MVNLRQFSIIAILLVFLISMLCLPVSGAIQDPYTVAGTVFEDDGTTVVSGATVVIENTDTGEKNSVGSDTITGSAITVTTDSNGRYTFELINLKSGYSDDDKIKVTASKSGESGSKTHNVVAGNWGAVVDVTFGEDDEDASLLSQLWDWLMSICGTWWGLLGLIAIIILIFWYFSSGKKKRRGSSN